MANKDEASVRIGFPNFAKKCKDRGYDDTTIANFWDFLKKKFGPNGPSNRDIQLADLKSWGDNIPDGVKNDLLELAGISPQSQQGPTGPQTQQGVSGQQQDLASDLIDFLYKLIKSKSDQTQTPLKFEPSKIRLLCWNVQKLASSVNKSLGEIAGVKVEGFELLGKPIEEVQFVELFSSVLQRFDLIYLLEYPISFQVRQVSNYLGDEFGTPVKESMGKETCYIFYRKEIKLEAGIDLSSEKLAIGSKKFTFMHTPVVKKAIHKGWSCIINGVHFRPNKEKQIQCREIDVFFSDQVYAKIQKKFPQVQNIVTMGDFNFSARGLERNLSVALMRKKMKERNLVPAFPFFQVTRAESSTHDDNIIFPEAMGRNCERRLLRPRVLNESKPQESSLLEQYREDLKEVQDRLKECFSEEDKSLIEEEIEELQSIVKNLASSDLSSSQKGEEIEDGGKTEKGLEQAVERIEKEEFEKELNVFCQKLQPEKALMLKEIVGTLLKSVLKPVYQEALISCAPKLFEHWGVSVSFKISK